MYSASFQVFILINISQVCSTSIICLRIFALTSSQCNILISHYRLGYKLYQMGFQVLLPISNHACCKIIIFLHNNMCTATAQVFSVTKGQGKLIFSHHLHEVIICLHRRDRNPVIPNTPLSP